MLSIISLGAIPIMAAGAMTASATMAAGGLVGGAATMAAGGVMGTVRLAKDSVQALAPIGAGGSQARKRLMERGLIESGVNRTKQLKRMAGKTAGLLGINLSIASILKQSQIFTGVFGTVFQILGAFVDIMLIPLMPTIKWILNGMIDFIPDVQAASAKMTKFGERVQNYLQELFEDGRGLWGKDGILYKLAADTGTALKNWWLDIAWPGISSWWTETAWPAIEKFINKLWNMTPWGTPSIGKEGDAMVKKMEEMLDKHHGGLMRNVPKGSMVEMKPGFREFGFGFGGTTDEFEDLGFPEGYQGDLPKSFSEKMGDVGAEFGDVGGALARGIKAEAGSTFAAVTEIPEAIFDIFGKDIGSKEFPLIGSLDEFQQHRYDGAELAAQEMNFALGALHGAIQEVDRHPISEFFKDNTPGKDIIRSMVPTINDMAQELGSAAQFHPNYGVGPVALGPITPNQAAANTAINLVNVAAENAMRNQNAINTSTQAAINFNLSNQAKENYAASYKDEASQYEDELYFQEMMLGVGRY